MESDAKNDIYMYTPYHWRRKRGGGGGGGGAEPPYLGSGLLLLYFKNIDLA